MCLGGGDKKEGDEGMVVVYGNLDVLDGCEVGLELGLWEVGGGR